MCNRTFTIIAKQNQHSQFQKQAPLEILVLLVLVIMDKVLLIFTFVIIKVLFVQLMH
jgi:hypothetical protein